MKTCSKCGNIKSFGSFHRNNANRDGYENQCKECRSERMSRYYQENKEERDAYTKKRREILKNP